ncbi:MULTISPECIES: hypothetical protein [Chryseobacterium]|uniref:Uncharacterized protein n=1 Tax=Chryseobacterium salivictor TaxID=2547600 RepID=A0A4P6ZDM9_9FLAO|nr:MULTISPECIES: hypothetical protein [Chryseobacterium]MDQ0476025.1 hypothetical protein [Chryseobacterium sp. MDT2-18]QBO57641.1 hypothetical protein NBC122_00806 [Chryseobacterium salivictor]
MKSLILFLFTFTLMLTSCNKQGQENQIKEREAALLIKEEKFAEKEQDYEALKMLRDSLKHLPTDTINAVKIPEKILGKWNGKMICTESNCSEHVIGDLRNDLWEFTGDHLKITNKSGGEKIYTGKYNGSELKLTSENNSPATNQSVITLQLSDQTTGRIKGSREFTGNNCISKFSVELEKIKN